MRNIKVCTSYWVHSEEHGGDVYGTDFSYFVDDIEAIRISCDFTGYMQVHKIYRKCLSCGNMYESFSSSFKDQIEEELKKLLSEYL